MMDFASGGNMPSTDYGPGRSLRPLMQGQRSTGWREVQFSERGNARMVSDGHWKLVRYYQRDPAMAPVDTWYDLSHPFGERHISQPPRQAVADRLISELDRYFSQYETAEHSGRRIWEQPPPNARMRNDLANPDPFEAAFDP